MIFIYTAKESKVAVFLVNYLVECKYIHSDFAHKLL